MADIFFLPQILRPTRVTDHSATIIDNIFFNSLEHHSVSGNIVHDLPESVVRDALSPAFVTQKMAARDPSRSQDLTWPFFFLFAFFVFGVVHDGLSKRETTVAYLLPAHK